MALLDYSDTPTPRDFAQEETDHILEDVETVHRYCVSAINAIYARLWSNQYATVDQLLAKLGPKAMSLFVLSGQFQELLNDARPSSINLSPLQPVTFNQDGTVVITPQAAPVDDSTPS